MSDLLPTPDIAPASSSDERVLRAIAELRTDTCGHLHSIEADVKVLAGRADTMEGDVKAIKTQLEQTDTLARATAKHDAEHEGKVAQDLLEERGEREKLESRLSSIEDAVKKTSAENKEIRDEVATVDKKVDFVQAETVEQTRKIDALVTSVTDVVKTVGELAASGKKILANPALRSLVTVAGATICTWAAAHGCVSLQPIVPSPPPAAVLPATIPVTTAVPVPAVPASLPPVTVLSSELTPYERDVIACGASAACEESVRARHGRPSRSDGGPK